MEAGFTCDWQDTWKYLRRIGGFFRIVDFIGTTTLCDFTKRLDEITLGQTKYLFLDIIPKSEPGKKEKNKGP